MLRGRSLQNNTKVKDDRTRKRSARKQQALWMTIESWHAIMLGSLGSLGDK